MSIASRARELAKRLAFFLPALRQVLGDRTRLQQRVDELEDQLAQVNKWGSAPVYDADFLRVWNKTTDFLADERFLRAYMAGMHTDHRQGRHTGYPIDLHIEWRILVCCWAAWHAKQLEGDFVECGTNVGIMSVSVCNYIDFNTTGKRFYLFDTYCGIPDEQILPEEGHARDQNTVYRDCYETAKRNFSAFPNAVLVRGKVPTSLSSQIIDRVCYLMLDMNIVAPERAALEYFWPKMVPGGIVLFDDYGWAGHVAQKRAHDTFASSLGVKILNLPTGQGMLIKP